MSNINILLKLNGLLFIVMAAWMVFAPQTLIDFLSLTDSAPEMVVLLSGVGLNLQGLFLLWLGNQNKPSQKLIKASAVGDFLWALTIMALVLTQIWITNTTATTLVGLMAIGIGWLGWLLWQHNSTAS